MSSDNTTNSNSLHEYRCRGCGKLLCKGAIVDGQVETKCKRCDKVNLFEGELAHNEAGGNQLNISSPCIVIKVIVFYFFKEALEAHLQELFIYKVCSLNHKRSISPELTNDSSYLCTQM